MNHRANATNAKNYSIKPRLEWPAAVNTLFVEEDAEATWNLPAMRRQMMHMENATSIMMGSCTESRIKTVRLSVSCPADETIQIN